jgi:hypothetical protein
MRECLVKLKGSPDLVYIIGEDLKQRFKVVRATSQFKNSGESGVHMFLTIIEEVDQP